MSVALRPIVRDSTITDAKLAAGPAISKTNATPGLRPLSISDIAIGIDPVAHTYMGTATSIMTPIARSGYRLRLKYGDQGGYDQTYHQPFAYACHHVNKSVTYSLDNFSWKAQSCVLIFTS